MTLEVRVLGPLDVRRDGTPIDVRGTRPRAVLVALALRTGEVVAADHLVEVVWDGAGTDRSHHTLQQHVSTLRKALDARPGPDPPPPALETRAPGYVLHAAVDARAVDAAAGEVGRAAAEGRWADVERGCDAALARWTGPAIVELRGATWFDAVATRLDDLRLSLVESRAAARLALGRPREVVAELEALVEEHPYRERLCGQLMLALYREGRQADALARFARTRGRLAEDLGLEPSRDLVELEHAILTQAPALDRSEPPVGDPDVHATFRPGQDLRGAILQLPDGQIVAVAGGPSLLGRDPQARVRLSDSRVSRRHARIDPTRDGYVLRDLGSTNGTTVNGTPVEEHALDDGDEVGLGGVTLVFRTRWP